MTTGYPEPQTEQERLMAASAIVKERRRQEDSALIEGLTDRERLLIEEAWGRGAESARADLAKRLANPQAATLDAKAVADMLGRWRDSPDVFHLPRPGWEQDPRVIQMVRVVLRMLDQRQE